MFCFLLGHCCDSEKAGFSSLTGVGWNYEAFSHGFLRGSVRYSGHVSRVFEISRKTGMFETWKKKKGVGAHIRKLQIKN